MPKQINENKTKSELLVEINNQRKQIADNRELLIDLGIVKRETFMSRIEALEANTIHEINDLIAACVDETGRDFPMILVPHKRSNYFNAQEYGTFIHEQAEKWLNTNSNQG